ncbi:MAG: PEP-CTERM sorting domain-containing protein [Phycisphaerae bacterium]|nr:PEP-CTERM sorting domain-containing protein [Phycisphaerae bacterium]
MVRIATVIAAAALSVCASAEPIMPEILAHDFNYGAYNTNSGIAEYLTNGNQPDTLTYHATGGTTTDQEVTAYWPTWPTPPVFPVLDLSQTMFGGDFGLSVQFDGQDAPYTNPGGDAIDVSLTGTGATPAGQSDLVIYGTIMTAAGPMASGLLWSLDLQDVVLYGRAGQNSYVVEGFGMILDCEVAEAFGLVGQYGSFRGHLEFGPDAFATWIGPEYDPMQATSIDSVRASLSGETGWTAVIPEPTALALLGIGFALIRRR